VPGSAETTVAHVDMWADPDTGLPLQAEVTAKGGARPVFVTRFLEVRFAAPDPAVLVPPVRNPDIGFHVTAAPDLLGLINRRRPVALPDALGGRPRHAGVPGLTAAAAYGTGLTSFVVTALPRRIGAQAYQRVAAFGTAVEVPAGGAALIATGLLTVLVVQAGERTYLAAGFVQPAVLERAAGDLARTLP
jgi:hypothetical protein